jgi:hypothetical protein
MLFPHLYPKQTMFTISRILIFYKEEFVNIKMIFVTPYLCTNMISKSNQDIKDAYSQLITERKMETTNKNGCNKL